MYFGTLSDFFYKGKNWLINQPRITKEKSFQFIKLGGKIFKLNIYTGVLYEINTINKINFIENTLRAKKIINDNLKLKKNNTNIKLYLNNKKEKKNISSCEKNILSQSSLSKKIQKTLNDKRNKSSNINNHFSLIPKNSYKKKMEKTFNLYLNHKYKLITNNNKNANKKLIRIEKYSFKGFDTNDKNSLRCKSYNNTNLNIKKSINYDSDLDNIFIQDDADEIKKGDNRLITKVKDQIFKDKMFRILRKKYNFYKDNNKRFLSIPKLKLDTARKIYIDKKNSISKKLYLNKTLRIKSKTQLENKIIS